MAEFILENGVLTFTDTSHKIGKKVLQTEGIDMYDLSSYNNVSEDQRLSIRKIVVPEGVRSIEEFAFSELPNLEHVLLPESLETIGRAAFADCPHLKTVTIPDRVTTISREAFFGCKELQFVHLPENLANIQSKTFALCESITEISLPKNLRSIDMAAFYNCTSLTNVNVSNAENLRILGGRAFSGCKQLKCLDLPGTLAVIKPLAFENCDNLIVNIRGLSLPAFVLNDQAAVSFIQFHRSPDFQAIKTSESKIAIALELADELPQLEEYLRRVAVKAIEQISKYNNIAALDVMINKKFINAKNIDKCIAKSIETNNPEIQDRLLDCKKELNRSGKSDRTDL